MARLQEQNTQLRAVLDDVALLGLACLDLHELELDPRWQREAEALARELLDHYAREGGGLLQERSTIHRLIQAFGCSASAFGSSRYLKKMARTKI